MRTISVYLNLLLLKRLSIVLFAVLGFATVFDLLDAIDDVVDGDKTPAVAIAAYVFLRLPSLLSQLLPLICLLGGLFFITELMRNNELIVIWAMGRSTRQMINKLMPVLLLIVCFKLILDDQLVPWSIAELRDWRVGAFKRTGLVGGSSDGIWLKSGRDIVRLPADDAALGQIRALSIFRRDDTGRLIQRIEAERAEKMDAINLWRLHGAKVHGATKPGPDSDGSLLWQGTINVDHIRALSRPARELSLFEQIDIIRNNGFSIRAVDAYITWAHHRITGSIIPSLLLALVLALARSFSRSSNALRILVPSVALGFSFLILNGIILALGEVGIIAPVIAAWLPTSALFSLIAILLVRTNRLAAMRLTPEPLES